ncbi:M3 family metallopeptidase [Actinoplanes sp. HUAS TT8]|uniref:M3 family metallopeptidase n=1 Tax=Actinoplanes sp. HUAS TT8 TaxID=3447453 RepID=UPI003F51CDE5
MNSFDHPLGEVRFDTYRPEDVPAALDRAEAEANALLDAVAASAEPLVALGEATARYHFVVNMADELGATLGGAWTEASRVAAERSARFSAAVHQRADLYEAIRAVTPAGPVEERLRADLLWRFERHGAGLDAAGRERLATITARLAALSVDYMTNLQAADAEAGVATDDPAGLPEAMVAEARKAAAARGRSGYWLAYSDETASTVRREATNAGLRADMYRLTINRAAASNGPVVTEMLAGRQELAELLGFPDFVAMQAVGQMVGDAQGFLDELAAAYRPAADREHAELLAFARSYTNDPDLELTAADVDDPMDGFYVTRLRESRGLAAAGGVRVPVETVQRVMFDALAELYSVTFTPVEAPGWHPDVRAFDLRDDSGTHLARIWCDWHLRDGKQPGAWMAAPWLSTDGGPHHLGVIGFVPPEGADLLHMRIMWHEFGHAMHYAFVRTRYRLRTPTEMPRDFIEGPSRIMENWPMDPEILRRMGVGEEAATAARAEERFRLASRRIIRMTHSFQDLALHRGEDPLAAKQRLLPVPVDPADESPAQILHTFAGSYGARLYTYQWAGVLDAALFGRFEAEGLLNPATGRDYARTVLAPGAERDPAGMVRDFLGHDLSVDALLERDGVR